MCQLHFCDISRLSWNKFFKMGDYTYVPRKPRIVIPGQPHHVTQRGGRGQDVFFIEDDRQVYLDILRHYAGKFGVEVLAYCLMTNHVHHLLVPPDETAIAQVMQPLNTLYAHHINTRMDWQGHLWQERFYSAPVDNSYFWIALRYIERNPVEAKMVDHACNFRWSSAPAHCKLSEDPILSVSETWQKEIAKQNNWYQWLQENDPPTSLRKLRTCTAQHLPCGNETFIANLELELGKPLCPRPKGRPRNRKM